MSALLIACSLSACGGGSGGPDDSTSPSDDVASAGTSAPPLSNGDTQDADVGPETIPDQSVVGSPIPPGNDDVGIIPEITGPANPDGGEVQIEDPDVSAGEIASPPGGESDPREPEVGADVPRYLRWRSAFDESPSSALDGREPLLETVFELVRYDFVIDLLDELAAIQDRIVSGAADFEFVNVSEGGYVGAYLCADSGRVLVGPDADGQSGNFLFQECRFEDTMINGVSLVFVSTDERETRTDRLVRATAEITLTRGEFGRGFSGLLLQSESAFAEGSDIGSSLSGGYVEGLTGTEDVFAIRYSTASHVFVQNREGRDAEDIGVRVRPFMSIEPTTDGPGWTFSDFTTSLLTSDELDGTIDFGQVTLDDDARDDARLVFRADNGDPDSFDLFGFSSTTDVNSRGFNWSDTLSFEFPRLLRPL